MSMVTGQVKQVRSRKHEQLVCQGKDLHGETHSTSAWVKNPGRSILTNFINKKWKKLSETQGLTACFVVEQLAQKLCRDLVHLRKLELLVTLGDWIVTRPADLTQGCSA